MKKGKGRAIKEKWETETGLKEKDKGDIMRCYTREDISFDFGHVHEVQNEVTLHGRGRWGGGLDLGIKIESAFKRRGGMGWQEGLARLIVEIKSNKNRKKEGVKKFGEGKKDETKEYLKEKT